MPLVACFWGFGSLFDYNSRALVLKTSKFAEDDRLLLLYSPEQGPLKAIAKGAAKASSPFAAKTQILNYCDFQLTKGRNLDVILQAQLIEGFLYLQKDLDSIYLAYFMLELLAQIAVPNHSYQSPFQIVLGHLEALERQARSAEPKPSQYLALMAVSFLWSMIDYLGYRPDLHVCALSQRERQTNQIPKYFDLHNGAIVSSQAYAEYILENPYQNHIVELGSETYRLLRLLEANSEFKLWDLDEQSQSQTGSEEIDCPDLDGTLSLLIRHLSHQIQYEFKTDLSILRGRLV